MKLIYLRVVRVGPHIVEHVQYRGDDVVVLDIYFDLVHFFNVNFVGFLR